MKRRGPGESRRDGSDRGYTTVNPQGTPRYLPPHEPACQASQRYMAVHRVTGGWGIVDRRTGRLLSGADPDQCRYPNWDEVQSAVRTLNDPGMD
jgi:hypothetical protein